MGNASHVDTTWDVVPAMCADVRRISASYRTTSHLGVCFPTWAQAVPHGNHVVHDQYVEVTWDVVSPRGYVMGGMISQFFSEIHRFQLRLSSFKFSHVQKATHHKQF
jgi:hypothetical protein